MSMIRLPPTSISLSESDIQLHLRNINIYQGLLEQGFTRQAIQRYYASARIPLDHSGGPCRPHERTERPSKDEAGYDPSRPEPASSHCPEQQALPLLSALESQEAGTGARSDAERGDRAFQGAFWPAVRVEQEPRREDGGGAKQSRSIKVTGPADRADEEIVSKVDSRRTTLYAPSTVDLQTRRRLPSERAPPLPRTPPYYHGELSPQLVEGHERLFPERSDKANDAEDWQLAPLASNLNLPMQYRPRQSSTLHITRNADSPSSSGQSEDSFKSTVTEMPRADSPDFEKSPRTRKMTYRPRSHTYPWVQSEVDETIESFDHSPHSQGSASFQPPEREFHATPADVRQISVNMIKARPTEVRPMSVTRIESSPRQISISTPLRAEAEDFVPLKLPPPFSATRRVSSDQHSLPSSIRNASPSQLNYEVHSRSSPNLAISTPPRSSSIGSITRHLGSCFTSSPQKDFPSSPPNPSNARPSPLPGPSTQVPTSPSHRGRQVFRETQTRAPPKTPRGQARMQQTDGPGTVYNDQVPAHLQPRTPADLMRGVRLTAREAAYTAPPGRTARTPVTVSQTLMSPVRAIDTGEESPSRRARTMRERRQREIRRSAVVEEAMWSRFREMEGDFIGMRMPWHGPGPGLVDGWRDEFDADRVGEENFDEEGFMRTPRLDGRIQGSTRGRRQS